MVVLEDGDFHFVSAGQQTVWHNTSNPLDTNGDGLVSPIDALRVINELNRAGARLLSSETVVRQISAPAADAVMVDTTGDGFLSPIDALRVIRHLNSQSVGQAAAPPSAATLAAIAAALDDD